MVLIFDAANILMQGYSPAEVFEQYLAMKPGLGWMHIKDYRGPQARRRRAGHVDEEALANISCRPTGRRRHEAILRDFSRILPAVEKKLDRRGIPGVFLDLEPHLKGGGQFGGFSGPDGMGVALRGLCRVLTTSASTTTSAISTTSRPPAGSRGTIPFFAKMGCPLCPGPSVPTDGPRWHATG